jgi:hypothetical protein
MITKELVARYKKLTVKQESAVVPIPEIPMELVA